jgi:hypothetical protein
MGVIMRIVQKVSLIITILISADIVACSIGMIQNDNEGDSRLHDLITNNKNNGLFNHCRVGFPVE